MTKPIEMATRRPAKIDGSAAGARRGGSARLARRGAATPSRAARGDGPDTVHAVDEHREDDAEGDDRDAHPIAEAEDHDQRRNDSDRRRGPQELDKRLERLPDPSRRPHRDPDSDADTRRRSHTRRRDASGSPRRRRGTPAWARHAARALRPRSPSARGTTPRPRQRLPDTEGRSEHDQTEEGLGRRARRR